MDPNDHERPLAHLGEPQPGPPPSADTLTDIVARYRRRRTRMLGGALVVALLAGPAAGFAVGRARRGSGQTVATAGGGRAPIPRQDNASSSASGGGVSMGMTSNGMQFSVTGDDPLGPPKRVFVRDASDGIRVRVYLHQYTSWVEPGERAECSPKQYLDVQVSDDVMAENVQSPLFAATPAPRPVTVVGSDTVGEEEGSPVDVVTLRTATNVARVKATFIGGVVDEMAPVDGSAVLAGHGPATSKGPTGGTLTALNAAGKVLATVDLASPAGRPTMPAVCATPMLPPGVPSAGSPPPVSTAPATVAPAAFPTTSSPPPTTTPRP
ncbi:MAG TPA: hypothetical protein VHS52_06560 [Acidimicrobiales bacterium]|nr:hypothetical protein [Acidimicrobiales bacterium]